MSIDLQKRSKELIVLIYTLPFLKKSNFWGLFHFLGGKRSLKEGPIISGWFDNKLSFREAWKLSIFNTEPGWNSKFCDFSANSVWNAES